MIYNVTLNDGTTFQIEFDIVEATAPILVRFDNTDDEDNWQGTPYQTADANDEVVAAGLVNDYFREHGDWSQVQSVTGAPR